MPALTPTPARGSSRRRGAAPASSNLTTDAAPKKALLEYSFSRITDRASLQDFAGDALALMSARHRATGESLPIPHFQVIDYIFEAAFHPAYAGDLLADIPAPKLAAIVSDIEPYLAVLPQTPPGFVEVDHSKSGSAPLSGGTAEA